MINQREFIRKYNDTHREEFNPCLFEKDDNAIIEELKKVILSCQRSRVFTIKVLKFTVVEDYDEIYKILYKYEKDRLKAGEENRYDFISLKDSDIKLLIVDYYLAIHHEEESSKSSKNLRVIIEVPRVVDKYYYKIFGNLYASTYQIIESTYNNSASSNAKSSSMVALKTMFMASRFYRFLIENSKEINLVNTEGNKMGGVYYQSRIFGKFVLAMKYLLARYGLYQTQQLLKVPNLYISNTNPKDPNMYTCKIHKLYVSSPKYLYDKDQTLQSLFYTVCVGITKDANLNNIYTVDYWLKSLGKSFNNESVEKGLSILESLESIYDLSFKEHLHLPDDQKKDIYDILIWIIREFSALRLKDNLDLSKKRIRDAEYIALLYAMKISKGIYRISDKGNKVTLQSIEKAINTYPDFLLKAMVKDSLINCRNSVNDLDAITALKYTYKGVSGLGEGETSIPQQYRQAHNSQLGRIDIDAVSSTDPGLTGIVCPMAKTHNGSFSEDEEPNTWREEVDQILSEYRDLMGLQQLLLMKERITDLSEEDKSRKDTIEDSMRSMDSLMKPISSIEQSKPELIPLILGEVTSK